ncbi:MAG: class I SAM-dependent methyltransferase [Proteobacteria bacterium]|nr:class I SAM-dependent methyltransferase [Pseudomonadota bacterium]MBU1611695.1 class I SAM-dependent methyltransferase [Pseudomonadota bacterium]
MSAESYDRLARIYDPVLNPFLDSLRASVCDALVPLAPRRVVDLCCGTGRQAIFLHRVGMDLTGVDLSAAMLAVARDKSPAAIRYIQADASSTGLQSGSFDAVVASLALHELPKPLRQAILVEAVRLAGPGATICITDYRFPDTLPGRLMLGPIALVERMAGREHYRHFRDHMRTGATEALLQRAGLSPTLVATHMRGCVGVYLTTRT